MRILSVTRTVFWFAFFTCATACAQSTQPNGCGSDLSQYVVPDRLLGCELKAACDAHDVCYAKCVTPVQIESDPTCIYRTCEPGGLNVGRPICKDEMALQEMKQSRATRKSTCDTKLFANIRESNGSRPVCRLIGRVYEKAVAILGDSSFFGTTVATGNMTDKQRQEYKAALDQFFSAATGSDIEELEKVLDQQTSSLDLTKPIRYDKQSKTLQNATPHAK